MPVPTTSKLDRDYSPPAMAATPARQNFSRLSSVTAASSYSPTVTNGVHTPKLNVVTRIAIEGKAKRGQDGASVRMFLKIAVPLDSPHVSAGATIPLFPEENIKVLSSKVHPLDQNSVPYNFSAKVSPLLYNAARALGLPARSAETFESAFDLPESSSTSSARSSKVDSGDIPPVDVQYTGQILVSGYSVAFVLPKTFLQSSRRGKYGSDNEDEGLSHTPISRRRSSIGERHQAHFMAAIDMWIPFLGKPPRYPFLVSIPTPRCLHNQIKLRIFPPDNTSASMASLSSLEDDGNSWDLTSDPHVTRSTSTRPSRSKSYSHFADDESSDYSTTGTSDACVIQGTFPSAERIRIRWAKPMKTLNIPGFEQSGRRRVGVEQVKGEMIVNIRGKGTSSSNPDLEGILMHVEYKGQCKGVWFAGVATMLGLDVGLEAKGADVSWPQGHPTQWEVSGVPGYTGFDSGSPPRPNGTASRAPSFDTDIPQIQLPEAQTPTTGIVRTASTSSTSSLLRAPLPVHNLPDYSFEGSNGALPSTLSPAGTMSSISSLPTSSAANLGPPPACHPGSPITLHLNMNELVKNSFTFTISGTVLITARSTLARINASLVHGKVPDLDPVVLPRFTVLAADSEATSIIVRNDTEGGSVEVFHPTGDIQNDPQTRKTVLQKGGYTKCGEDGGRIALKVVDPHLNANLRPATRPRTASNSMNTRASSATSPVHRSLIPARGKREGPPMISSAQATVTFLTPGSDTLGMSYAVRVKVDAPALADPEWLEFGFAKTSSLTAPSSSPSSTSNAPLQLQTSKVRIVCASLDGVPVKFDLSNANSGEANDLKDQAAPFERLTEKEWLYWGKIYNGTSIGGTVILDYIVKTHHGDESTRKKPNTKRPAIDLQILLPTFFVAVARFEVLIDPLPDYHILPIRSNFNYHHSTETVVRLLQYSSQEFAHPQLVLNVKPTSRRASGPPFWLTTSFVLTWILLLTSLLWSGRSAELVQRLQPAHQPGPCNSQVGAWGELPTVTVTTTLDNRAQQSRPWFGEMSSGLETPTLIPSPSSTISISSSSLIIDATPTERPRPTQTQIRSPPSNPYDSETSLQLARPAGIWESLGLAPAKILNFTLTEEHKESLRSAAHKVASALHVVWQFCRKAYHYPLPPP